MVSIDRMKGYGRELAVRGGHLSVKVYGWNMDRKELDCYIKEERSKIKIGQVIEYLGGSD